MALEQIHATAMNGHRRRIRQRDALVGHEVENPMLALWVARVRLEGHRAEPTPISLALGTTRLARSADLDANSNHECKVVALQELDRSAHGSTWWTSAHSREHPKGVEPFVQRRLRHRSAHASRSLCLERFDHAAQTDGRGRRHRLAPS